MAVTQTILEGASLANPSQYLPLASPELHHSFPWTSIVSDRSQTLLAILWRKGNFFVSILLHLMHIMQK
jgi:hypothetical protein